MNNSANCLFAWSSCSSVTADMSFTAGCCEAAANTHLTRLFLSFVVVDSTRHLDKVSVYTPALAIPAVKQIDNNNNEASHDLENFI
jgi:hypothetical protein